MMRSSILPARLARTGCSVLALATVFVVGASPAAAQSFVGSGSITTNTGGVAGIATSLNTTTISVNPGQTVIDWSPTDTAIGGGTINFQPAGTTANFLGTGSFAVLNRINPADSTRSITMNGTIQALTLGAAAASNGSIYFYTPGGFVIGGSAVINVGSFVLSASPITVTAGSFINGAQNTVVFGQATQAGAAIVTNATSQINASGTDAYVAMVAPRVQHSGNINVAGSAALVGAEAATINFSPDGLFDIQVTTGTTDANGVVVDGNITGAASTGVADIHRAYLVAVPKNAAMTMLIANGSSLGFNIAGAANVVGNTVVLSAGYNVTDGVIESTPATAGNGFDAHLSITGANMSSALVAAASGNADIFSPVGQSSNFASDVTMRGVDRARVGASGFTTTVNIAGNLDLSTATTATASGQDVTSGTIEVYAQQNASVTVAGSTTLNSNAFGGDSSIANLAGGDAVGGDINIFAQTGGDINLNGGLSATANGYGGYAAALNATGGSGTGGDIVFSASEAGSNINVIGNMTLAANGFGGSGSGLECFSCDGDGGVGNGGTVDVFAAAGGDLNLGAGGVSISTNGVGGYSGQSNGGNAFGGGLTRIYADGVGSSVTSSGATNISSNATGGSAGLGAGGTVEGGDIDIYAQNGGNVLFNNSLTAAANGAGGAGATGGGDALGGSVTIFSSASLRVNGALNASANATGGQLYATSSSGFSAGDAAGGNVHAYAQGGTLTLVGAVRLSSNAVGGVVSNFADLAGNGTGGQAWLFGNASGIIDVQSTLDVTAIGSGGGSDYFSSGIGGNGLGGSVRVQATAANSSVTIAGAATLDASGEGSGSSGGNGTGGTAWADSFGAATASLDFLSDVFVYAQGRGGDHNNGNGGNGQGGQALLQSQAGTTLTVGGNALVDTNGFGGYSNSFSNGVGGNGTGGQSRIQTFPGTTNGIGGTIVIDGSATASAGGSGGDSYSYVDGVAGNGTGGSAHLITTLGNITIGAPGSGLGVNVSADGYGGDANNGTGGNGTGGAFARIEAINGDITIEGFASVSASGFGGDGLFGGNGLGSGTPPIGATPGVGGAHIFALNGDIVIKGGAGVSAVGTGGDGGLDNNGYNGDDGGDGGNGTGGWASIHAANSNLGPSTISIDSGGYKDSGSARVNVSGTGGDGGNGNGGNAGGNGGDGGIGQGGTGIITAAAGNGTVNIGGASAYATGNGGFGGNGGNGDGGSGGNGGNGGNGFGGVVNIGTESGSGQSAAVNNGVGNYGSITADASAFGGDGGGGNFGSTSGDGGNGGHAVGGAAILLVRGSLVDVDNATLTANATGGNAGFGYVPAFGTPGITGIGGDATVGGDGGIGVIATGRFLIPAQRGTLNAGSIVGTAIATPGIGIPDGNSQNLGGSGVVFLNADGNIGSLDFLVQTGTNASNSGVDSISVINGDVVVDGEFSFVTSGNLSLFLDNGDLTADTITWDAADFVPDVQYGTPTVAAGTFFARAFDITTGNNFITTAHLDSVEALTIIAPGAIQIGNVTGDANIVLEAQSGEIDIGNVLGGGGIDLDANDFVSTGNVVGNGLIDVDAGSTIGMGTILNTGNTSLFAGVSINVGSIDSGAGSVSLITNSSDISGDVVVGGSIFADSGGDLFLGNLTAPGDIELLAVGDMLIGNALAGESIDLDAGGYVDGGTMTAGDSVYVGAGTYVDLLNISAGIVDKSNAEGADYNVGILAGTTINTGNISAFNSIGLGALGNITTGTIDAGNIFLALGGGNMSFGTINAGGPVYLADDSMIPLGGDPTEEGSFDPAPILAATPVVSGGSITLRGAVTAGRFVAAASGAINGTTIDSDTSIYTVSGGNTTLTDLDAGTFIFQRSSGIITENDLDAGTYIDVRATGGLALGDLVAGDYIDLRATGAIGLGTATSGETIYMLSGTSITGANMTAGNSVLGESNGAIQLGNITAGITDPSTSPSAEYAARFSSGAAITTGNVTALGRIGFGTPTNLLTGNLDSGAGLMALVGGNMTSGTINADDYVYLANYSMSSLGGAFLTFNRAPILALAPVATGGSINIGAVVTGNFEAAAGTTLTGTTINSGNLIHAFSGGNMTLGNLFANNDIRLTSGANIVVGSIDSGDDVALIAAGSISTLDIFAYDDVSADAGTTITTDDITGNSIDLFADGDISTGNLLTQDFFGGQQQLFPGASITVRSGGDIDTGTIDSIDGVYLAADDVIRTGNIFADTFIETLSGGSQGLGNLTAGDAIELDAEGGIAFGVVNAESLDFTSGGAVTGGNITALSYATGEAEGAIVLGNITTTGAAPIDDFSIGIASATSILVGNASGTDRVGFATLGDLTTGNITAGRLFMALVGGNMTTGSITTAANGRVYIADSEMFATGGGDDDFDASIVLALAPVATGGSVTINGAVTTGRFQAAAGDNLSTRAITANQIDASAGDNATLDGMWRAGQVSLRSGNINITANGGIDAGTNGSILLNAVNTDGPALIGDGLTGNGYALSNAEFGRISGGDITIEVGGSGGDADTLIGDLTITGPLAGSNIESNDGGVHFVTLQEDGLALDGTLRIVGDVVATGFGAENYLAFYTQNFELDAATGSISITGSGNALAGILELYASRIHVAEGSLLDQLAVNPQFAGYREALNRPAAVARPGGVINAASFDIEFGGDDITGPYTLFVQNMGTTTVPAGFLLNAANISDDGEGDLAAGSIDMAINGQIIAEGATLTGIAVRDLLVTEFGTNIFVAGSTINGCPLTGSCSAAPPRIDTIVRTDVQINDGNGLGDGVDGSLSNPPNPLLDTDFLGQSGDVDDPVSGAGNPSLIGTSEDDTEVCDSSKDSKCKPANKGDDK